MISQESRLILYLMLFFTLNLRQKNLTFYAKNYKLFLSDINNNKSINCINNFVVSASNSLIISLCVIIEVYLYSRSAVRSSCNMVIYLIL